MADASRFWDKTADKYARMPITDEASYQHKLQATRALLRPEMEVLEFGCGTGSTAILHAPHVQKITAIDLSERMLEIARDKAAAAGVDNIRFERATIDDYEAAEGSFDMVLGLSILHLVADRDAVIRKVHRLLKPGGHFVSSTACLGDTMAFFKVIGPIGKALGFFPLLRVFKRAELAESIRAAGFEIVEDWQPGKGKAVFVVAKKAA
ncbi:MAG TPA: class I SAM-dependent methyltransferase [Devosiaceae bacterium]|jgi:ubiquinone/menaquinone biosynthesis C-methylase UbiE|nr:class I SAM-dependent methyltransferase [Devosiaceae bacterium]